MSDWYQQALRKVRKYDTAAANEFFGRMVAADYESGRKAFPVGGCCTKAQLDAAYRYRATHKSVAEQWLEADMVRRGIDPPQKHVVAERRPLRYPVYYASGSRRLFSTIDEALDELASDENAVRLWDCESREYLVK